jgi:hypothetical protein
VASFLTLPPSLRSFSTIDAGAFAATHFVAYWPRPCEKGPTSARRTERRPHLIAERKKVLESIL